MLKKRKADSTDWLAFAESELISKKRVTGLVRDEMYRKTMKAINKPDATGIVGYKKAKLTDYRVNFNPDLEVAGEGRTFFIAKKSQAPSAKALRQMSYYFDYDDYNDKMNELERKGVRIKGVPDKRRKKKKDNKKKPWDVHWEHSDE